MGGGGLRPPDQTAGHDGDLADVALNWMLWQARAATLRFDLTDPDDRQINHPTLHDDRPALAQTVQDGDCSINTAAGPLMHYYQDNKHSLDSSRRDRTETLIALTQNTRSQ